MTGAWSGTVWRTSGTEREKRSSTVKVVLFSGGMGMRLRLGAPAGYAKGFFYRKASLDVTIGR